MAKIDYKAAGVDIAAGEEAINRVKKKIQSTFSPAVLTDIGGFGATYDLKNVIADYDHPVMVQSIDGVGTKTMLATLTGKYHFLGHDLLSATCNDIVVMGAKPLTFLDYIASDSLDPAVIAEIIEGMVEACLQNQVSLTGGETAEMPKIYNQHEHDLVGIVTGVVDKNKMITGKNIQSGDVVFGITSSGLHTNGYSLARKLFFDENFYAYDEEIAELNNKTLADVLQAPHINYTRHVHAMLDAGVDIHGMVHITGGGFISNIPRVLPDNCSVNIKKGSWPVQPVFTMMQALGELDDNDMFHTFNMGIGLVVVAPADQLITIATQVEKIGDCSVHVIGEVYESSKSEVRFNNE